MNPWLVWLVVVTASVLLGFVASHFTVRTLRIVTAALATAVVVLRDALRRGPCGLRAHRRRELIHARFQ